MKILQGRTWTLEAAAIAGRTASKRILGVSVVVLAAALALAPSGAVADPGAVTAATVSVGSPSWTTPQNVQNEATVAVDAHDPNFLIAGAHDFLDQQPCPHERRFVESCRVAGWR